jgi:ribose-phosphate pyrophosphokinase
MLPDTLKQSEVLFSNRSGVIKPLVIENYPSGEPMVKETDIPISILLRPKTLNAFWAVMFWADALRYRGYNPPELVIPFVPGARQDRPNPTGDQLFTARSIAAAINQRNFPVVNVLDPHSTVISGMIDRCNIIDPFWHNLPPFHYKGYTGVISPDSGADKRSEAAAKLFNCPVYHAGKTRDIATGNITGFWCQPLPEDGTFIIIDDICDGGGTFVGLANEVQKYHPKHLSLHTTHGLYSKGTEVVTKIFRSVFCSDSIVGEKPGVIVSCISESFFLQTTNPFPIINN